tara:strand:+ start:796 stop:975 length:180 start_codon:yes stop_codon:yes gene_type:complete
MYVTEKDLKANVRELRTDLIMFAKEYNAELENLRDKISNLTVQLEMQQEEITKLNNERT